MSALNVCALRGCKRSVYSRKNISLRWHKFPFQNSQLLEKWIEVCQQLDETLPKGWRPSSESVLCSSHFKPTDFLNRESRGGRVCLRPGSIPSCIDTKPGFSRGLLQLSGKAHSKMPDKNTKKPLPPRLTPKPLSRKELPGTLNEEAEEVEDLEELEVLEEHNSTKASFGPKYDSNKKPEVITSHGEHPLPNGDPEMDVHVRENDSDISDNYHSEEGSVGAAIDIDFEKHRLSGMCRVCASSSNRLILLFEDSSIVDKIHTFLPILVTPDDLLPVSICDLCLASLEQSHRLVQTCLKADEKLRGILEAKFHNTDREEVDPSTNVTACIDSGEEDFSNDADIQPPSPVSSVGYPGSVVDVIESSEPTINSNTVDVPVPVPVPVPIQPEPPRKRTRSTASPDLVENSPSERITRSRLTRNDESDLEDRSMAAPMTTFPSHPKKIRLEAQPSKQDPLSPSLRERMRSFGIKEASVVVTKVDFPQNSKKSATVATVNVPLPKERQAGNQGSRRLYRCLYCNETGSDAYKLLIHQIQMHPGNLLKCSHCGFVCGSEQKQNFDAHMLTHKPPPPAPAPGRLTIKSIQSLSEPRPKSPEVIDITNEHAQSPFSGPNLRKTGKSLLTHNQESSETPNQGKKILRKIRPKGPLPPLIRNLEEPRTIFASKCIPASEPKYPIKVIVSVPKPPTETNKDTSSEPSPSDVVPVDIDSILSNFAESTPSSDDPKEKSSKDTPSAGIKPKSEGPKKSLLLIPETEADSGSPGIKITLPAGLAPNSASAILLKINMDDVLPKPDEAKEDASTPVTSKPKTPSLRPLIPVTLYQCAKCRMNFDSKEAVEKHVCGQVHLIPIAPKPGSVTFPCTNCGEVFYDSAQLREHLSSHATIFQCEICGQSFRSEFHLRNHMRKHVTEKQKFKCTHEGCTKEYSARSKLRVHMYSHSNEPRCVCPKCGKVFRTDGGFRTHWKAHENTRPYACSICGQRFNRAGNMRRHEGICNAKKSLTCRYCNATFEQRQQLLIHRANEHSEEDTIASADKDKPGEQRYTCRVCQEGFIKVSHMRKHQAENHTEEELEKAKDVADGGAYLCNICGKQLYRKHNYRIHMLHHQGKYIFKCHECGTNFTSKFALNYHMTLHTGDLPHKCSDCNEGFRSVIALQVHRMKHTGEKPYKCRQCDMGFFTSYSLRLHLIVHSNNRQFTCKVCGSSFKRRKTLRYHSLIHTGEKPHQCKYCGKCFRQKGTCNIHERNHLNPKKSVPAKSSSSNVHSSQSKMRIRAQQRLQERVKNIQWKHPTSSHGEEAYFVVQESEDLKPVTAQGAVVETEIIDSGLLSMYQEIEMQTHEEIAEESVRSTLVFPSHEETIRQMNIIQ